MRSCILSETCPSIEIRPLVIIALLDLRLVLQVGGVFPLVLLLYPAPTIELIRSLIYRLSGYHLVLAVTLTVLLLAPPVPA